MDSGEGLEKELKMQERDEKLIGSICALEWPEDLDTEVLVEGLTLNRVREQVVWQERERDEILFRYVGLQNVAVRELRKVTSGTFNLHSKLDVKLFATENEETVGDLRKVAKIENGDGVKWEQNLTRVMGVWVMLRTSLGLDLKI